MNKAIQTIFVNRDCSIRHTMETITAAPHKGAPTGIALVIDKAHCLIGVVTDGDIRRALVKNVHIDSSVRNIMVRDPITVEKGLSEREMLDAVTAKVKQSGRIRDVKVDHVIVVDEQGRIDDVINFFELWKGADQRNKRVCVVGTGFVGLTLSVGLVDVGFKVIGYELRTDVVRAINRGYAPFHEKGLPSLLKFHVERGNLRATAKLEKGMAEIYVISVGTPIGGNRKPNLRHLKEAAQHVGKVLRRRDLVVLRSTVPVGTTRTVIAPLLQRVSGLKPGQDFYLAFAPERTVEGKALEELRSLPQVVGGINRRSLDAVANFFANLSHTIVRVKSLEASEMVKLVNNCFRDVSFGFANELAMVCDRWDLDAVEVIQAANEGYPRNKVPLPSPGVGGVCLKKDPYIYANSASNVSAIALLPQIARRTNEGMPLHVLEKVKQFGKEHRKGLRMKVFVVGFAFKGEPETSDLRDSATLEFVKLAKMKTRWRLFGYDPVASAQDVSATGAKSCSLKAGFKGADCILFMNNHRSYTNLAILDLVQTMKKTALFFDGWALFPKEEIEKVPNVIYAGIGG